MPVSIEKQSDGSFCLRNAASGKLLDVAYASGDDGANVQQWERNYGDQQKWWIEKVGSGYKIINKRSGKALDVSGRSRDDNANVLQWRYTGGSNQIWAISPA